MTLQLAEAHAKATHDVWVALATTTARRGENQSDEVLVMRGKRLVDAIQNESLFSSGCKLLYRKAVLLGKIW